MLKLIKAISFSAKMHENQRRKNKDEHPYINHPIGVMEKLAEHGETDLDTLMAAVCHDVIEDTACNEVELIEVIGEVAAGVVFEVSNDPALSGKENKERQAKVMGYMTLKAQRLKVADKIKNCQDILFSPPDWTNEKKKAYFLSAKSVVDRSASGDTILDSLKSEFYALFEENINSFGGQ